MAAFTDYVTVEGERMLAKAVAGQNISFTKVAIGSGELASGANPRTMTALITQVKEIDVQSVTLNSSSSVLVSAYFTNRNITTGFYFREKGIYMSDGTNEVLGIYGNAGADADYIDTNASVVIERLIKSVIELTDQEMANIEVGDYIYEYSPVLADDVQTIADFVKTTDALAMKEGQRVIINNKKAYTYVGGNQREISNYITGTAAVRAGETIKTADPSGYNTIARRFAIEAESYAVGGTGTRENENIDNAKYYYNQIKNVSESISGALRPCGTIEFANLPDVTSEVEGNMYNISDEFVTTDQFKEGAGYTMPLGTNIYVTSDGFWDCLPGSPVTGVKGDKETEYRRGNVNITPENIGALPESEKDETEEGTMAYNIAKLNNNLIINTYQIRYDENLIDTNLFASGSAVYITTYGKVAIIYGTLITKTSITGSYPAFNTVAQGITPHSQSFALNGVVENNDVDVYFPVNENKYFAINVSRGAIPAGTYIRVFGAFIFI